MPAAAAWWVWRVWSAGFQPRGGSCSACRAVQPAGVASQGKSQAVLGFKRQNAKVIASLAAAQPRPKR
eukprot:4981428-Prymnesium_polylepis.1